MLRLLIPLAFAMIAFPSVRAEPAIPEPPPRVPKYPLKAARVLTTDEEIAHARANVKKYPEAAKLRDAILGKANTWLAWEDRDLVTLITPARIPRAFNEGTAGCPKCGKRIYEVG